MINRKKCNIKCSKCAKKEVVLKEDFIYKKGRKILTGWAECLNCGEKIKEETH